MALSLLMLCEQFMALRKSVANAPLILNQGQETQTPDLPVIEEFDSNLITETENNSQPCWSGLFLPLAGIFSMIAVRKLKTNR